jgi:hypothetical protein
MHPGSAIRHDTGGAAGPHRSELRLYWNSRNRLLNAARHLPPATLVKSVLSSAAFDTATIVQEHDRRKAGAIARGWWDGLRAMRSERRARSDQERRRAARRLVSFRTALAEQRRLGRI